MPSPFPGMDPFIESSGRWGDFHGSMIAAMRNELNRRLPDGYAAEIELYVWFHEPDATQRRKRVEPDVYMAEEHAGRASSGVRGAVTLPKARYSFPSVERRKHKSIRVLDMRGNRVVTAIEFLSPINKSGDDREIYLNKRNAYLAGGVNLVEIDLLRGGRRLPLSKDAPKDPEFYILVCRSWEYPRWDYWDFGIRDPLPVIPVPLAPEQADVPLPLRVCMDEAYDGGKYRTRLPYSDPVRPRLSKNDAAWVRDVAATA